MHVLSAVHTAAGHTPNMVHVKPPPLNWWYLSGYMKTNPESQRTCIYPPPPFKSRLGIAIKFECKPVCTKPPVLAPGARRLERNRHQTGRPHLCRRLPLALVIFWCVGVEWRARLDVDWLKSHGMEARAPSSNSVPPWEPYSIDIFKFHPHALSSDLFHVVMFF